MNTCAGSLADTDPEVQAALERERERQTVEIELIAAVCVLSMKRSCVLVVLCGSAKPNAVSCDASRWWFSLVG